MASELFPAGAPDVLYVVDMSSYVLRAYHAIAPLTSPSGEPTHAVHGTVAMLERLLRERRPALFAIAMDSGRATFRSKIYPQYKANRPPAPDPESSAQFGLSTKIDGKGQNFPTWITRTSGSTMRSRPRSALTTPLWNSSL